MLWRGGTPFRKLLTLRFEPRPRGDRLWRNRVRLCDRLHAREADGVRLADRPRLFGSTFGIGGIAGILLGDGDGARVRLVYLFPGEGDSTRVLLVDRCLPLVIGACSTRVLLEDLALTGEGSVRVRLDERPRLVRLELLNGGWSRDSLPERPRDDGRRSLPLS